MGFSSCAQLMAEHRLSRRCSVIIRMRPGRHTERCATRVNSLTCGGGGGGGGDGVQGIRRCFHHFRDRHQNCKEMDPSSAIDGHPEHFQDFQRFPRDSETVLATWLSLTICQGRLS